MLIWNRYTSNLNPSKLSLSRRFNKQAAHIWRRSSERPGKERDLGGQQIDCLSADSDLLVLGLEESSMESRGNKQYCLDS